MKKLTKSGTDIVLTGTIAGIAEYLKIDPTILRIIYVVILFLGWGSPIFLYIVLAILIPSAPRQSRNAFFTDGGFKQEAPRKRKDAEKVDDDSDDDWSDF